MRRRALGMILLAAGGGLLAVAGALLAVFARDGRDWSGTFLARAAATLGVGLLTVGVPLVRGQAVAGPEKRKTSRLVVALALLLFAPMLAGAALLFVENFRGGASAGRWAGSSVFLAVSFGLVVALLRDLVSPPQPPPAANQP